MPRFLEARQMVLDRVGRLPTREVALEEALGRAVAQDLHAPDPVPPFTNSAMDGFALRAVDLDGASADAPVRLPVAGELAAGQIAIEPVGAGSALRIMTGAPMPMGADAVVPIEWTRCEADWVEVARPVRAGSNIRLAGEDIPQGGLVVAAGASLGPGEIGVLAATGFARVPVVLAARVAIITTGDELVDCGAAPGPGQIRDANLPALCAQISTFGATPVPFARIPDQRARVEAAIRDALTAADMVLTTGGVSVGDWDFVKPVLEDLGAEPIFWRVDQKPGGPLGFWMLEGKPILGIPGNPVAAMVMVEEYVRPALRKMMGFRHLHRPECAALLDAPWRKSSPDGRVHFLRAIQREEGGIRKVSLTGPQGSGILSSMLRANALALIPEDQTAIEGGGTVQLHLTGLPEDR